ncbi:unnamed protein product [Soboliphyme baturini]|uniref:Target of rapamycin complex subunit lst8 n=1 Tax=Soboliphyme baturini TaxID=241478 RepID=A0A183IFM7_9BILA|nr:unnamed protein product [Soboliphyme baturini]
MAEGTEEDVVLASGSYDHTVRLWNVASALCIRTMDHADSQVNKLEVSPDGALLAAAGYQHIRMYDLKTANACPFINYEGMTKNVTTVGFHTNMRWMFTGGEDNSARIWDLRNRNLQCQRIFQVNTPVNCVCLHPNQVELFVGDQSGTIHLWDLRTDHNEQLLPEQNASIQCLDVDPEGTMLAAVNNKGMCYLWNLISGIAANESTRLNPKIRVQVHQRYALKCKFSPDSTLLLTTSADHTAKVWKTADFSELSVLTVPGQKWVWDCAFTLDSQYALTCSSDNAVRLWRIEGGAPVREYIGHQKAVTALAFRDVRSG